MFQSPSEYAVAVVSSCVNPVAHTPVSSDDGFCGSSDISDPSIPNANNHLLISYRQPYILMKESILMKNTHSPSFISLSSTNVPDVTRRVRFNLESNQILDHSTKHSLDPNFQRIEQIYLSQDEDFEQLAINSTVVQSIVLEVRQTKFSRHIYLCTSANNCFYVNIFPCFFKTLFCPLSTWI